MALEQRFYSCAMATREQRVGTRTMTVEYPSILDAAGVSQEFSTRDLGDGDPCFLVGADTADWEAFDATYPNQDSDSGDPYRRRYPRVDLPYVDFTE